MAGIPATNNSVSYQIIGHPQPETIGKKAATKLGLVSLMSTVQKHCTTARNSQNRCIRALKQRALAAKENIKSCISKAINTAYFAAHRAVVCGAVGGLVGGTATAIAVGVGIANPLIGVPMAIGVGLGATGFFTVTGAGFGATLPITKEAGRRLLGMNTSDLKKRIVELEKKNIAQTEMMDKYLSDGNLTIKK